MAICPQCKVEIETLNFYGECVQTFSVYDECPQYNDVEVIDGEGSYECTECNEILFDNEDEAEEFLKEKLTPLQEVVKDKINSMENKNG